MSTATLPKGWDNSYDDYLESHGMGSGEIYHEDCPTPVEKSVEMEVVSDSKYGRKEWKVTCPGCGESIVVTEIW